MLPGGPPVRPGLIRSPGFVGPGLEVEVWELDDAALGSFLAEVPEPLGVGTLHLVDGSSVLGFLCEGLCSGRCQEITAWGLSRLPGGAGVTPWTRDMRSDPNEHRDEHPLAEAAQRVRGPATAIRSTLWTSDGKVSS